MAKFNFSITAHVGDGMMLLYSNDFNLNVTEYDEHHPVLRMTLNAMRFREWTFDDGNDSNGTTYCQYVSYDGDNHDNYLLAVWCEVDEESGCIKL